MAYGACGHGETNGRTSGTSDGDSTRGLTPLGSEFLNDVLPGFDLDRGDRGDGRSHATLVLDACGPLPQALAVSRGRDRCPTQSLPGPDTAGWAVGMSIIGMALWTLKPDRLEEDSARAGHTNAFLATSVAFFIAEINDKTQIATVALAAAYPNLLAVIAGTTTTGTD